MVLCDVPSERCKNRPCGRERDRQWGDGTGSLSFGQLSFECRSESGEWIYPISLWLELNEIPREKLGLWESLVIWWSQVRMDLAEKAGRCSYAAKVGMFLKRFYINRTESQRCPHFWLHTPTRMTDHCFVRCWVPGAQIQTWAQFSQRINNHAS